MGMEILIEIFFSHSRTRGHEVTLVKDQMISVDWISGSTRSHRGQSMNGTNHLHIV